MLVLGYDPKGLRGPVCPSYLFYPNECVSDVDFLEDLYSKSWMKITVGTRCSAPIQLDTGTVQGSVLSPLLFDLFLNALLRLLDATGITHGIKRTPQWNHAAFADDLSIYVGTVRDGNKLLDVIHEF